MIDTYDHLAHRFGLERQTIDPDSVFGTVNTLLSSMQLSQ